MVRQLRSQEFPDAAPWTRKLRLLTLAAAQIVPIMLGIWVVANSLARESSGASISRGAAGLLLVGAGTLFLHAAYLDWRRGVPLNRQRSMFIAIALLYAVPAILILLAR